jgi:hypothetical protein
VHLLQLIPARSDVRTMLTGADVADSPQLIEHRLPRKASTYAFSWSESFEYRPYGGKGADNRTNLIRLKARATAVIRTYSACQPMPAPL